MEIHLPDRSWVMEIQGSYLEESKRGPMAPEFNASRCVQTFQVYRMNPCVQVCPLQVCPFQVDPRLSWVCRCVLHKRLPSEYRPSRCVQMSKSHPGVSGGTSHPGVSLYKTSDGQITIKWETVVHLR